MKVITLAIGKGGCGKSSLSLNFSYLASVSAEDKKVLIIDLDSQANSSFIFQQSELSSYDLLITGATIKDCASSTQYKGIDVISADFRLSGITTFDKGVLKGKLSDVEGYYDYVIIDTPPSLNNIVQSAILSSDLVVIPVTLDVFGFLGARNVISLIEELDNSIDKIIVPNLKLHNSSLHTSIYEQLIEYCSINKIRLSEPLSQSVEMSNVTAQGKILAETKGNNKLKLSINHLFMKEIKVYG